MWRKDNVDKMPKKPSAKPPPINWRNSTVTLLDQHYFGHDDRVPRNSGFHSVRYKPRVSFKTHMKPNREIRRNLASLVEDEPMVGANNNNKQIVPRERGRGIVRGRNSPLPKQNFRGGLIYNYRYLHGSNEYRVSIPYGHKYEKDYIINILSSHLMPDVLIPIMYKVTGTEASFYVDNDKMANLLQRCDRKITLSDNFKMHIRVKPGFAQCEMNDKLKERLKQAMVKRYRKETNALDLSKFHLDPDLINDYFCGLFRPVFLTTVLDIVAEHIPDLEALNLEGNKLSVIEKLNVLNKKFPKLKILYIGNNYIRQIHQLDSIKDLKLEELRLADNLVCNKYKSQNSNYVSDVRKRFPKLLRLDGVELPRPIVFDVVDEESKAPSTKRLFANDPKTQEIASQFMQQYFLIFDSGNRQPLLNAYDEHAFFSITLNYSHSNKSNGYLFAENRNLFRINDTNKRHKLLKQGKLPVVSFITEMPQTRHFLETFTMDINVITQTLMVITVTGFFKEIGNKEEPIRFFNRTFTISPEGNGYCIRNEQLHISQPTEEQLKRLMSNRQPVEPTVVMPPQMTSPPLVQQTQSEILKPVSTDLSEDIKQQMVVTLSQQTNMNMEWSLKCLQDMHWYYEAAFAAFQDLFKRGQVPSEAFTK